MERENILVAKQGLLTLKMEMEKRAAKLYKRLQGLFDTVIATQNVEDFKRVFRALCAEVFAAREKLKDYCARFREKGVSQEVQTALTVATEMFDALQVAAEEWLFRRFDPLELPVKRQGTRLYCEAIVRGAGGLGF